MSITLEHFCTKTGKSIFIDGKPLTETIEHCLAEYFAPSSTFKLGAVYQGLTKEADLQKFSKQGLSLEFAADDRFYFMDEALREKVFDQPHFGAAYGSNMFTPCKSFSERQNLRVLLVDASTGANGGVMPNSEAIKFVGDGDGKIDAQLHQSLGNEPETPFQTRFGIKERRAGLDPNNDSQSINQTWQVGKGTFAPRNLSNVGNGYDLIISTDQLKGRVGERGSGRVGEWESAEVGKCRKSVLTSSNSPPLPFSPSPTPPQPGEYLMTMGIGNKTDAYYGITSTGAQFWNLFPEGVKGDVLPRLERRLEELSQMASDPRKIAADYIELMDDKHKHQIKKETEQEDFIDFDSLNLQGLEKLIDDAFGASDQDIIYRVLKADLQGHCQLLEHPKIVDKLAEHWRQQYMDCATGRFIKFDSAMAQTCHDLEPNEVCYPNKPDGTELIVYRSPVANSNTVDVYINRHLPNEPNDIGTIKMAPQGLKHSLSDCDGDRMAIALASDFPHTTAEIKEKQLSHKRYAEIVKPDKKAYTGSFEQIALDAMENKVGLVANLCMKSIALENECVSIPNADAWSLMKDISCAAAKMLLAESNQYKPVQYPDSIKKQIKHIAQFCVENHKNKINIAETQTLEEYNESRDKKNLPSLSSEDVNKFLEKCKQFYHDLVGVLGGQLQIEVDRGKSANRSDPEIVNACSSIIKTFDVAPWVEERKVDDVYTTRGIKLNGHGAIDIMSALTNEAFTENTLQARSTQQFQDLFKQVTFTSSQRENALQIKKTYDTLINRAIEIGREVEQAPGPRIIATSPKGNQLEILGLAEFKHPNAFDNRKLDILIVENNDPSGKGARNKWIALAPVFGADGKPELKLDKQQKYKRLGYISQESAKNYPEITKQEFKELTAEIVPGITQSQVRAAFKQVREFADTTAQSIPDSDKEALATAMWQVSTASKEDTERGFKKTSAVFAIFGEELVERLHSLQFTDFAVVGTHKPCNEHLGRSWGGEKVGCSIEKGPDPANPEMSKRWLVVEDKKLGVFRSESAQLPIGTSFEAEITSPKSAAVIITSTQGNQLKVGQLKKYAFADREWKGEQGTITINCSQNSNAAKPIALVDGKPLGVIDSESFAALSEKLRAHGKQVQGFQFKATLESAPATVANIKVNAETIKYPEIWTSEQAPVKNKQPTLLEFLKPLLKEEYKQKNHQALLHDDEASLKAVPINSDLLQTLIPDNLETLKQLSQEINKKLGTESFIAIAQKGTEKELYFCSHLNSTHSNQADTTQITDTLNFPLEYDQLQNSKRTKFIAVPLDELLLNIFKAEQQMQLHRNQATAAKSNIATEKQNPKANKTNQQQLDKAASSRNPHSGEVVGVRRPNWEQNLINASFAAIKDNPVNKDEVLQTGIIDSKYVAIYHAQKQTLSIVNDNQEVIYKAAKNQEASINKLTTEEQQYWQNTSKSAKQQKLKEVGKDLS
ncbi:hypothetical protein DSM106972_047650 [Dulcicalothrix desertica PCC 7102]|uniref:Uncharacterized protein n=1 Tax=Dulcicalothrix desertica PCC 7102 TaxID=232991 RepID=A0A433VCL6_9CYAN|nr:hypothetical protein [Dulcicalothrix desertica]RUT03851.1 hypothetical protein DSM106972_047650 [Dulcicalothrix desertica PCC 7102]TWH43738.1 hypothetical protein CAL7102_07482 [Dulcicalothrix desertica PCC 7102]